MPLPRSYMDVGAGVYPSRFLRIRSRMIPARTSKSIKPSEIARPIRITKTKGMFFPAKKVSNVNIQERNDMAYH